MSHPRHFASLPGVCCILTACGWLVAAEPIGVRPMLQAIQDANGQIIAVEASSLPANIALPLSQQPNSDELLARVLSVSVADDTVGQIAIAGSYSLGERTLRFTPRFAFRAGQAYCAVLRWRELEPASDAADRIHKFQAQAGRTPPPAEVTAIFPSAAIIPENQLRFYIHFSAPMSRPAYDHVQLLDSLNRPIDLPFLELGEELWDPQQQRLTLLVDPGRIKRGVTPREVSGTVLRAGEQFTLVVQSSWLDAQNRPLRKEFVKHFRAGPPIEEAIDPAKWQIRTPASGSHQPLTIVFPRPLDHALLQRLITVRLASGPQIEGEVLISREEQRWELRPTHEWPSGKFEVVIDSALEDLAGNRIGRAFEVDVVGPVIQRIQDRVIRLEFEIRASN